MFQSESSESDEPLDKKIERIQEQNEKIKLRYLEVEEDKKSAMVRDAMVNVGSSGKVSTSHRDAQSFSRRGPDKYDKRRTAREEPSRHGQEQSVRQTGEGNIEIQTRRPKDKEPKRRPKLEDRNRKAGISRGRGIRERDDVWRKERERIDQERIDRQKTNDGQWRRDWDNVKDAKEQVHTMTGGRQSSAARFTPGPPLHVNAAPPRVKSRVVETANYRDQVCGHLDIETHRRVRSPVVTSDTFYDGRPTPASSVHQSDDNSRHAVLPGLTKYDLNKSTPCSAISHKEIAQPPSNGYISTETDSDEPWEDEVNSREMLTKRDSRAEIINEQKTVEENEYNQ